MHPDSKSSDRTRSNTPLPLHSPFAADAPFARPHLSGWQRCSQSPSRCESTGPMLADKAWIDMAKTCAMSAVAHKAIAPFLFALAALRLPAVSLTPEIGHENLTGVHRSSRHHLRDRRRGVFLRRFLQRGRHIRRPRLREFGARPRPPGLD